MKDILVVLLLIAVVILVFGAINQDQTIDFDYLFGTWQNVSAFTLAGIGAGLTFLVGLCAAGVARAHVLSDRRKLEKELEQVYVRLRAAEQAAGTPPAAAGPSAPAAEAATLERPPAPAEAPALQEPPAQPADEAAGDAEEDRGRDAGGATP